MAKDGIDRRPSTDASAHRELVPVDPPMRGRDVANANRALKDRLGARGWLDDFPVGDHDQWTLASALAAQKVSYLLGLRSDTYDKTEDDGHEARLAFTIGAQRVAREPGTRDAVQRGRAKERIANAKKARKATAPASGDRASTNFRINEFDTHDGTPVPRMAYGGLRNLCERVLEPMRAEFGACIVLSGYRHASYNRAIGGATRSYHVYDLRDGSQVASDLRFARGNPALWAAFARRLGVGGVGQYNGPGFVHVDNGPRRDWRG